MKEQKLLNWRQACQLLGCSRSHFYNLVNSCSLPALRHGEVKGVRVYERDCLEYLRQRAMQEGEAVSAL